MDRESEITREKMEEFRREKLNIEVKVIRCRRSEGVLVVKMENEHTKKKIMRNKSKLKGRNFHRKQLVMGRKKSAREN